PQLVVLGGLRLDRNGAAARHLALQEEVAAVGLLRALSVAALPLRGAADGEDVLVAVERAVHVVAGLRIPEVVLCAPRGDEFGIPRGGAAIVGAAFEAELAELAE